MIPEKERGHMSEEPERRPKEEEEKKKEEGAAEATARASLCLPKSAMPVVPLPLPLPLPLPPIKPMPSALRKLLPKKSKGLAAAAKASTRGRRRRTPSPSAGLDGAASGTTHDSSPEARDGPAGSRALAAAAVARAKARAKARARAAWRSRRTRARAEASGAAALGAAGLSTRPLGTEPAGPSAAASLSDRLVAAAASLSLSDSDRSAPPTTIVDVRLPPLSSDASTPLSSCALPQTEHQHRHARAAAGRSAPPTLPSASVLDESVESVECVFASSPPCHYSSHTAATGHDFDVSKAARSGNDGAARACTVDAAADGYCCVGGRPKHGDTHRHASLLDTDDDDDDDDKDDVCNLGTGHHIVHRHDQTVQEEPATFRCWFDMHGLVACVFYGSHELTKTTTLTTMTTAPTIDTRNSHSHSRSRDGQNDHEAFNKLRNNGYECINSHVHADVSKEADATTCKIRRCSSSSSSSDNNKDSSNAAQDYTMPLAGQERETMAKRQTMSNSETRTRIRDYNSLSDDGEEKKQDDNNKEGKRNVNGNTGDGNCLAVPTIPKLYSGLRNDPPHAGGHPTRQTPPPRLTTRRPAPSNHNTPHQPCLCHRNSTPSLVRSSISCSSSSSTSSVASLTSLHSSPNETYKTIQINKPCSDTLGSGIRRPRPHPRHCDPPPPPHLHPDYWPQRTLLLRPTPGKGTRIIGVRYVGSKAYLWKPKEHYENNDDYNGGANGENDNEDTVTNQHQQQTQTQTQPQPPQEEKKNDNHESDQAASSWWDALHTEWAKEDDIRASNSMSTRKKDLPASTSVSATTDPSRIRHKSHNHPYLDTGCPECCILPINNGNEPSGKSIVVDFRSNLFEGTLLLRIRGSQGTTPQPYDDTRGYFSGMNRRYQAVVRGRFIRPDVRIVDCVTGQAMHRPLGKLPPKFMLKGALKVLGFFAPQLTAKLDGTNEPRCVSPLGSAPQSVSVVRANNVDADHDQESAWWWGDETLELHLEEPLDPSLSLLRDLPPGFGGGGALLSSSTSASASTSTDRARMRKKAFDRLYAASTSSDEGGGGGGATAAAAAAAAAACSTSFSSSIVHGHRHNVTFRTDAVYTFEFLQHLVDFNDLSIELGSMLGKIKLADMLDGQPLKFMAAREVPSTSSLSSPSLSLSPSNDCKKTKTTTTSKKKKTTKKDVDGGMDLESIWSFDIWHRCLYDDAVQHDGE